MLYIIYYILISNTTCTVRASLPRARILIRWFANTARGHFLLWNKTEPTAWLNQYRGLECYRKPRKQTKCICFHSKSMAEIVLLLIYKPEKTWKANEVADVGCHRIFDGGIFSRGTHLQGFSITSTHWQGLSSNTCSLLHFFTSNNITSTRHLFLRFNSMGFPPEVWSEIGREISCTERGDGQLDTLGI